MLLCIIDSLMLDFSFEMLTNAVGVKLYLYYIFLSFLLMLSPYSIYTLNAFVQ